MNLPIAVILCALSVVTDTHYAEVSAPWKIPPHKAHAFLKAPTRNKRSDPRCNTDEPYCEHNMNSCMLHNEQSREHYCGLGHTCTAGQSCYLSTPCPAHYALGCTDEQCKAFPCNNGGTCEDTTAGYNCHCVPGWDPATDCSTDYDECQSVPCLNGGSCNNLFNQFTCDCTGRYEGDICEKDCRPGPVDVVFLIDTSASVENNVNRSIDFINEFVSKVPIGPNDFQVAAITYNYEPTVLFDLNDYTSAADIRTRLQTVTGQEAATYTAPAIRKAAEMNGSGSMGARGGTMSLIILLYDGLSSDRNEAIQEASIITSRGGRVLTVGVGQSISHSEMLYISKNNYHTYNPLYMEDLYSRIFKESSHADCSDCTFHTETDVMILLDTKHNQTTEGYNDRRSAIRRTIETVLNYNSNARIGMYSYSDESDEVFSLSWSSNKDALIATALQVDLDQQISKSNTSHALQHIRTGNYMSSARKFVIILSDGNWNDQGDIKGEIELLKQNGVEVFGIIAGEDCNIDSYNDVILDRSQIYSVLYDDFTSLESFAAMTSYWQCANNIFTLRQ